MAGAGLGGIQLFHGKGQPWPDVSPQIQCLSADWDGMIQHVGNETQRLGLQFTMQNCPGWAMSGGPWIAPRDAMRHLIWSRTDIAGGPSNVQLMQPQPSDEDWRDYQDVAVLAFPTPVGDTGHELVPIELVSNRKELPWSDLLAGKENTKIEIKPGKERVWLEMVFPETVYLRTIDLPPIEILMNRRCFDPDSAIRLQAFVGGQWSDVARRDIPRGVWQDRQPEIELTLAFPDVKAKRFKLVFENKHPMTLTYMRLFSGARIHNWRAQAGYVLRNQDRSIEITQDPHAWMRSGTIIDLSSKMDVSGNLAWHAPAGRWTIVRFGHVNTGAKNKPAPPEATGFECNKLSSRGADAHFAGYIGRVSKPGGPVDGKLDGMLIDSWECYTQTWTDEMEQEFLNRRGYALRTWLPALAGWVVDDHQTSERFLRDWRATISDLLVDNYFGRLAELGQKRGLKLSFETAVGDISPGDILQYYGKADIPMCEFWQPNDPHWGGFETKMIHPTTSAAHIYGKPVVAAEAFTQIGIKWDEHPFMLKHQADRHFAKGINHLIFHTYTHNPKTDAVPGTSFCGRIGTPFLRGQTWWKHMPLFTDYLARCAFMLQQGLPVSDVLWYLGDDLDHKPRQDTPFPDGYQFDYLNQDALMNRIKLVDGNLQTPEGTSWKVLWLAPDQCQRLTPATLVRLKELLQAGATVIGPAPRVNPSLEGESFSKLVETLWGSTPSVAGDRRIGKGRLLWGGSLADALAKLGIEPDVMCARSATWCHRRDGDTEIYFVAADRIAALNANLGFRATGIPEFWDPMTGNTRLIQLYHQKDGRTTIPMELPAAGSVLVIFRKGESVPSFIKIARDGGILVDASNAKNVDQGAVYPNFGLTPKDALQPWVEPTPPQCSIIGNQLLAWENGTYAITGDDGRSSLVTIDDTCSCALDSPWTLSFPQGWDVPERIDLPVLKPWSVLEDPATRTFSGTATYHTEIQLDVPDSSTRLLLDLGRVADIAEIAVNGKQVVALWAPPFRADITPFVKDGVNEIEVKVTNTWRNRLIYDASLPKAQRRTWTYSEPKANEALIEAGLIGPVVLRTGKLSMHVK